MWARGIRHFLSPHLLFIYINYEVTKVSHKTTEGGKMNTEKRRKQLEEEIRSILEALRIREEELAELDKIRVGSWRPEEGDEFFYISERGLVFPKVYTRPGVNPFDDYLLESGNCFKSVEKAEYKERNTRTHAELELLADWTEGHRYQIIMKDGGLAVEGTNYFRDTCCRWDTPWFASEESALNAIDTVGEERVVDWLTPYE